MQLQDAYGGTAICDKLKVPENEMCIDCAKEAGLADIGSGDALPPTHQTIETKITNSVKKTLERGCSFEQQWHNDRSGTWKACMRRMGFTHIYIWDLFQEYRALKTLSRCEALTKLEASGVAKDGHTGAILFCMNLRIEHVRTYGGIRKAIIEGRCCGPLRREDIRENEVCSLKHQKKFLRR